jgi:glycosyltransferase involved in cell wall biosynthesis
MNVGFDAKRLFLNFTGLGNYSRFMVNALYDTHKENSYFLFTPKVKFTEDTQKYFGANGITIVTPSQFMLLKSLWRSTGLSFTEQARNLQIYHGLSQELPLFLPESVKKVVTIHDLIFLRFPNFYKPWDRFIYKQKMKSACHKADAIVAISAQTADDLDYYLKIPREKISVIYQGCQPQFKLRLPEGEVNFVRKKYGLPGEYMLNVGTIESRKNLAVLVDAMALIEKSSRLPLVVVGRKTEYVREIMDKIVAFKLQSEVMFIHNIDFLDLPAVYQGATVFVYPSLFEGFGIPILEALQSGLPVITSEGSCFHEAGGPATRYVNPVDPEALAHALLEVMEKDSVRAKMISDSTDYIKRFEADVIANEVMNLYRLIS